jgi:leucyl/phenylalanyl-tRNA--protein transferase
MPVEPSPSPWHFPDPTGSDDDLVAIGADLAPGTLLAAYRAGLFPMPLDENDPLGWFSPQRRGVLPLVGEAGGERSDRRHELKVSASLRKSCRRFEIRVDSAFVEVMRACGDPSRDGGWITDEFVAAYTELHELGWAHSVEAWRDGELAGGLYGVSIGGLFAGESMFHRERDASKVALVGLVGMLRDEHVDQRLLDVQWRTDHLATLGVVDIPRRSYLRRLRTALAVPPPAAFDHAGKQ